MIVNNMADMTQVAIPKDSKILCQEKSLFSEWHPLW